MNEISKEPAARVSGKLSCNWLIMLATMATPISSHVKEQNSIFTARGEDMTFKRNEKSWYFISICIINTDNKTKKHNYFKSDGILKIHCVYFVDSSLDLTQTARCLRQMSDTTTWASTFWILAAVR